MAVTFGSLFSGVGGFDLGFERAGMECKWQCEIDKSASEVLAKHWPDVQNIGDVRDVRRGNAERVELICGGFPCQDLSVAGKRAGLAGERSGLWFEFARVIDELEPQWIVIENVPGLLSSGGGRDFAVIIQWLAQRGYGVAWRVLDSQYFGVPQRRRRVFIVGHLGDGRAAEVLFEREGSCWNTAPSREKRKDVAGTLGSGSKKSGGRNQIDINGAFIPVVANWQSGGGKMDDTIAASLRSNAEHSAQFVWNVGVRRLTPTECERLQGFPDGYTAGQSDSARYRQMGNAVTVNVIEWIGKRILEAHDGT